MRDLLSMDSGRQWSPFTDYVRLLHCTRPDGVRRRAGPGGRARDGLGVQQLGRADARPRAGERDRDARCRLRQAAPVRSSRDGAHVAVDRCVGQRADVRGHALDLPRPGALRRPDARPRNLERPADRLAGLGQGGHRPFRRPRSTPVTAICGGSTTRGVVASVLSATDSAGSPARRPGTARPRRARRGCTGRSGSATNSSRSIRDTRTVVVRLGTRRPAGTPADVRACRGEQGRNRGGRRRASVSTPSPVAGATEREAFTRPASR